LQSNRSAAPPRIQRRRVDCHVEVLDAGRWPTPGVCDMRATTCDLRSYMEQGPHDAVVIVQSEAYASAHQCFLDALQQFEDEARGVAVVAPYTPDGDIERFDRAGVRGARVSIEHAGCRKRSLERISAVHDLLPIWWHIEVACSMEDAGFLSSVLAQLGRPFVLPVGSSIPPREVTQDRIRWWLGMGNLYLKVLTAAMPPWIEQLYPEASDRLLKGSGWPFTRFTPEGEGLWESAADQNASILYGF